MQKIRAFTLFELLITISISALLVTFAFKSFLNFKQIGHLANNQIDIKEQREAFKYAMDIDILKSQFIYENAQDLDFVNEIDTVKYVLNKNGLIRISALIDSFDITDIQLHYDFQDQGLIKHIKVTIPIASDTLEYTFSKSYSALDLLEWERRRNEN